MNPLTIIKFAAPGLDEMMEVYPTYLNWKDKTADSPHQTKTEQHFANKDFYGKLFTTYAPITATMFATTIFLSQTGQDFFTNGVSAIDLATHFTENWNQFKMSTETGILANALNLGSAFVDFAKSAATEIMGNTNNLALGLAATIYASSKTIAATAKTPMDFLVKSDRKRESLSLESDVLSLLKEKSDHPVLEKYNDFDLFTYAHRFNDALYEVKDKTPNLRTKMQFSIIKFGSDLMEQYLGHDTQDLKNMLKTNNDLDYMKTVLSDDQVNALFSKKNNGGHREELYKINSDALKTANREKCEDEFVLAVVLMSQGRGDLKDNHGKAMEAFDEMKKTYSDFNNITKMKELDKVLKCFDSATGAVIVDKHEYNESIKGLIDSVPHLMRLEENQTGSRKRLTVNKIKIEDYYQSAFEQEINGKITEKRFVDLRKNYKHIKDSSGMMEALEEEMKHNLLFESEMIEQSKKDQNISRTGFIAEANDEMVFNDVSDLMKSRRLTNR